MLSCGMEEAPGVDEMAGFDSVVAESDPESDSKSSSSLQK